MAHYPCRFTITIIVILTIVALVKAQPEGYDSNADMDWSSTLSNMGGQFSNMLALASSSQMGLPSPQSDVRPSSDQPQHRQRTQTQPTSIPNNDYLMPTYTGNLDGMMSQSAPAQFLASPFASTAQPLTFGGQSFAEFNEIPISYSHKRPRLMDEPRIFQHSPQPNLAPLGPTSHPRDYLEPQGHSAATSFFDEGPFDIEMPTDDFTSQQDYPNLNQYDVNQHPWAQQQPQQLVSMQSSMDHSSVMSGSYTPPGADLPPFFRDDVNTWNHDTPPPLVDMQSWIDQATPFVDHLLPRLDTNLLAPPASSIARSPSSASSVASSSSRLGSSRRNRDQMTAGDFACYWCAAAFPTSLDLTHHLRSHAPYASRNHVCQKCEKRFQYRKDLLRHLPRHDPNRQRFYCTFTGCKYHNKGFGRRDHLERHVISQHGRVDTPLESSPA
ncbi:unnamed protein product [Zymoseptoria tritici ST99CH_1A5]|nr:unnamed protein product [Zymoseptoria tritici ST99CH_3D1]SMY24719.1 unnamed protein product [Zymoseptoria tritici ST99CH_1A5]